MDITSSQAGWWGASHRDRSEHALAPTHSSGLRQILPLREGQLANDATRAKELAPTRGKHPMGEQTITVQALVNRTTSHMNDAGNHNGEMERWVTLLVEAIRGQFRVS